MSTATLIMVVLICLGCGLGFAGVAMLGVQTWRLAKNVKDIKASSGAHAQEVVGRALRLGPRFRAMEAEQKAVAEKLSRFSGTARETD